MINFVLYTVVYCEPVTASSIPAVYLYYIIVTGSACIGLFGIIVLRLGVYRGRRGKDLRVAKISKKETKI